MLFHLNVTLFFCTFLLPIIFAYDHPYYDLSTRSPSPEAEAEAEAIASAMSELHELARRAAEAKIKLPGFLKSIIPGMGSRRRSLDFENEKFHARRSLDEFYDELYARDAYADADANADAEADPFIPPLLSKILRGGKSRRSIPVGHGIAAELEARYADAEPVLPALLGALPRLVKVGQVADTAKDMSKDKKGKRGIE